MGEPPPLDTASAFWRSFNLPGKQRSFETESAEILVRQEASAESRKELVEAVRAYKKLPPEERAEATNMVTLKFQAEVEALTKRARAAEKAFTGLVTELHGAPDPGAALGAALDAARAVPRLTEENHRLAADVVEARAAGVAVAAEAAAERDAARRDVAFLEAELQKLSNQDITIRQLESSLAQINAGIEGAVVERLSAREAELRRVVEAELEKVREAETAAEGRVAALGAQLAEAVAGRDVAQAALFAVRAAAEEEGAARADEARALAAESERLREALEAAEGAREEMRRRLGGDGSGAWGGGGNCDGSSSSGGGGGADPYAALRAGAEANRARAEASEEEAARLSAALAALQEESKRWAGVLENQRSAYEGMAGEAAARLAAREGEVAALRAALEAAPSPQELASLRNQLRLLQALHFNAGGEGGGGGSTAAAAATAAGAAGEGGGDDAVMLMLRRVRELEGKVVRLEEARAEAEAAAAASRGDGEKLREQLADAQALVAQLEDSLAGRLDEGGGAAGAGGAGAGMSGGVSGGAHGGSGDSSADAQLASLLPALAAPGRGGGASAALSARLAAEGGGSLALALKGQRDRFRARALELEAEVQARTTDLTEASTRAAKLTEDNVRLYEKIRFLQFMNSGGGGGGGDVERGELRSRATPSAAAAAAAAVVADATEDDVDSTYGKLYAEKLDPFAEYKSGEKTRGYAALRRTDRIVLKSSSVLLSSRYSRKALFLYAVGLHCILVYMLWAWIHSDCPEHAASNAAAAAAAAAGATTHHLRGLGGDS
jgi:homeobox protein cut-like